MDTRRQAPAHAGAGFPLAPARAQVWTLGAGERRTLPAGWSWCVARGGPGLWLEDVARAAPLPLVNAASVWLTPQPMTVWALLPLTLRGWPLVEGPNVLHAREPALTVAADDPLASVAGTADWRGHGRTLHSLQLQTAQWAYCRHHHTPLARAASWSLLVQASARLSLGVQPVEGVHDAPSQASALAGWSVQGARLQDGETAALSGMTDAGTAVRWPLAAVQAALGLPPSAWTPVLQALRDAGAWRLLPALAADGAGGEALVFLSHKQALQRLACGCHRPLCEALQASASASATLMPSTPADKIPPA